MMETPCIYDNFPMDRVFSEWLIPEPCEPFLPIPELQRNVMVIARGPRSRELVNLFSFKCLDTAKRSPKFPRQQIRGQLNSFRVGKSDLSEGNGQAPLDQCGQTWVDIFLNTRCVDQKSKTEGLKWITRLTVGRVKPWLDLHKLCAQDDIMIP